LNLHRITVNQTDAVAEAQTIGTQKVDMNVSGAAMSRVLEMVVLDILKAMAHFCFACADSFRPKDAACAFNPHFSGDGVERRIDYQLWAEGACT
jgi:hypothetical protein